MVTCQNGSAIQPGAVSRKPGLTTEAEPHGYEKMDELISMQ